MIIAAHRHVALRKRNPWSTRVWAPKLLVSIAKTAQGRQTTGQKGRQDTDI